MFVNVCTLGESHRSMCLICFRLRSNDCRHGGNPQVENPPPAACVRHSILSKRRLPLGAPNRQSPNSPSFGRTGRPLFVFLPGASPLSGWSGSLATIFKSGLKLLDELPLDGLPALRGPLDQAKDALRQRIERQRREEAAENGARSDTFE